MPPRSRLHYNRLRDRRSGCWFRRRGATAGSTPGARGRHRAPDYPGGRCRVAACLRGPEQMAPAQAEARRRRRITASPSASMRTGTQRSDPPSTRSTRPAFCVRGPTQADPPCEDRRGHEQAGPDRYSFACGRKPQRRTSDPARGPSSLRPLPRAYDPGRSRCS